MILVYILLGIGAFIGVMCLCANQLERDARIRFGHPQPLPPAIAKVRADRKLDIGVALRRRP